MNQLIRGVGSSERTADYAVGLERRGCGRDSLGRASGEGSVDVDGNGTSDLMVRIELQIVVAVLASAVLLGVARLLPEPPVVGAPPWWSDAVRPDLAAAVGGDCSRCPR